MRVRNLLIEICQDQIAVWIEGKNAAPNYVEYLTQDEACEFALALVKAVNKIEGKKDHEAVEAFRALRDGRA